MTESKYVKSKHDNPKRDNSSEPMGFAASPANFP